MTSLQSLIEGLPREYNKLGEMAPFADPNDKSWVPNGQEMFDQQDALVNNMLADLCKYPPRNATEAKAKADAVMSFHQRDPGNMLSDEHLRALCECFNAPDAFSGRLASEKTKLLNDLEHETSCQRDLLHLIADNLNEVYHNELTRENKYHIRMATTLVLVARDRMNDAHRRMEETYQIGESAQ